MANEPVVKLRKKEYSSEADNQAGIITFDDESKGIYVGGERYGGEMNVQADWNEIGTASPSYILNKPTITNVGRVLCFGDYTPEPTDSPMYFEAAQAGSTVSLMSMLTTAPNLEYSTDGTTWQEWQYTTAGSTHTFDTLTLTAIGDRVYLRGDNPNGLADMQNQQLSIFSMTGKINAGGNIMSLLDKTMVLTVVPAAGFAMLFGDMTFGQNPNTALLTPPAMDTITSVGNNGCYSMYFYCTSLTVAADMPLLASIGGYGCGSMYAGCTSLTSVADMPLLTSIVNEGCGGMYSNCTSLTVAADMPLLTSIGDHGCNGMYEGCTSLTSAADMPLLTSIGQGGCGSMYSDCTFSMSSDGTTFNFQFGATPPVTAGSTTYNTYLDLAQWMGNTNGFNV